MVLRDLGLEQVLAAVPKLLMGARLVLLHERRIAHNIRSEDSGELAFHGKVLGVPHRWQACRIGQRSILR